MEIIEVNHGIANRFTDGTIEVNKHLRAYPKLYFPIIKHELKHTDKLFSVEDLKHDINSDYKVDQMQLIKFMFTHPKSFTQLLPLFYSKKRKFILDINLTIIYSVILLVALLIYFIVF